VIGRAGGDPIVSAFIGAAIGGGRYGPRATLGIAGSIVSDLLCR